MWRTKWCRTIGNRVPLFIWWLSLILALAPASWTLSTFLLFTLPLNLTLFWFHALRVSWGQTAWGLKSRHEVRRVFLRPNPLKYVWCARIVRFHTLFIVFRRRETERHKSQSVRKTCADSISHTDPTAVTSWINSCRVRLVPTIPGGSHWGHRQTELWRNAMAVMRTVLQFTCFQANQLFWPERQGSKVFDVHSLKKTRRPAHLG